MWRDDALGDIRPQEELRLAAYLDEVGDDADGVPGVWTVGYGHTGPEVVEGYTVTPERAEADLQKDFDESCHDLDRNLKWWPSAPDPVKRGLSNMAFNMGWPRLSKFTNMLAAGAAKDYARMADEALDSKWAHQVDKTLGDGKGRADFIADLFRSAAQGATS